MTLIGNICFLLCISRCFTATNLKPLDEELSIEVEKNDRIVYEEDVPIGSGYQSKFVNPAQYQTADLLIRYKFRTLATATLSLSCQVVAPCQYGSTVKVIKSDGVYGPNCGTGALDLTSVGSMTAEFYSGRAIGYPGPSYQCILRSIPPSTCDCGRKPKINRIVGGVKAADGEFPWDMAAMKQGTMGWFVFCGTVLLSSRFILTAAHCTDQNHYSTIKLYAGANRLFRNGVYITLDGILQHPLYNRQTQENDIALMRAAADIYFTENLRPVCLPVNLRWQSFAGETATYSGWGIMAEGSQEGSYDLLKVNVQIKSNTECLAVMRNNIFPSSLCTYTPGKDACQGDSGGPLSYERNGIIYTIGVVSWGVGCGRYGRYGVNTRVTSHLDWIAGNTIGICYRN